MLRSTTLLAAGLLFVGSTTAHAQQAATITALPPVTITAPITLTWQAPDSVPAHQVIPVWEPSPTDRSASDIKHVQFWLKELKFYDGPTTGIMSPDTHAALRKFERAHNLPVTGQISDDEIAMLRGYAGPPPDCSW